MTAKAKACGELPALSLPGSKLLLLLITKINNETCSTSFKVSEVIYIKRERRGMHRSLNDMKTKRAIDADREERLSKRNTLRQYIFALLTGFHPSNVI